MEKDIMFTYWKMPVLSKFIYKFNVVCQLKSQSLLVENDKLINNF